MTSKKKNNQARILYVEDNPLNMRLVQKSIKHMGYDVLEAEDAEKGIEIALQETPDAILMDMHLPGMSGLEAVKFIKEHPRIKKIPLIALTADTTDDLRDACLKLGCDAYLNKPIRSAHLLRILAQFVSLP